MSRTAISTRSAELSAMLGAAGLLVGGGVVSPDLAATALPISGAVVPVVERAIDHVRA